MQDFQTVFLQFHYPELKELTLAFLTLASSIFTFTAVFSEKLLGGKQTARYGTFSIICAWLFLLASIIFGGVGLRYLFLAADFAHGSYLVSTDLNFAEFVAKTNRILFLAGGSFFAGMLLIGLSTILRLYSKTNKSGIMTNEDIES